MLQSRVVRRKNGIAYIYISGCVTKDELIGLWEVWKKNDCAAVLVDELSREAIYLLVDLILPFLPDPFFNGILSALFDRNDVPCELLNAIYVKGDEACKIVIALCDDLPEEVSVLCRTDCSEEVRELYFLKHPNVEGGDATLPPGLLV